MLSLLKYIANSTLVVYFESIKVYFAETIDTLQEPEQFTAFDFDEFQLKLLKVFAALLFINVILLIGCWYYYGRDIWKSFLEPSSTKEIEDLKASVAKLKLPNEYTSRI